MTIVSPDTGSIVYANAEGRPPWRDTASSFGWMSILLHWTVAFGVLAAIILGLVQSQMPRGGARMEILSSHIAIGAILAIPALARLGLRLAQPKPALPVRSRFVRALAGLAWRLLIALVPIQIMLGIALVWSRGFPVQIFGLARFTPPTTMREVDETILAELHIAVAYALIAIIAVHIIGAAKHLLVDRDGVVQRMIFPGRTVGGPRLPGGGGDANIVAPPPVDGDPAAAGGAAGG